MLEWRYNNMTTEAEKLTESQEDDEDEAFLKRVTFCEEDRLRITATPWSGGFRWFKSPNVIPIEQWRKRHNSRPAS
jgi:hypothetical protein